MTFTLGKFKATDVLTMATLLSKVGLGKMTDAFGRDNVLAILSENKGKSKEDIAAVTGMQVALKVAEVIFSNLESCETELFKLLSNISGLDVDEVKNLDAEDFMELVVIVVQHQQFKDFFKAASRLLNMEK